MDLRELKKQCRLAVDALVKDHGYKRDQFVKADGSETFDAPTDLAEKYQLNGFIDPGVHKGTLVYWCRCSHEYDEWECKLPSEILADILFWNGLTDEEAKRMFAE